MNLNVIDDEDFRKEIHYEITDGKTPPQPTGNKRQDLINIYKHGYKCNKIRALLELMRLKK